MRAFFEDAYREVLENSAEELHHPENFHIGGNSDMTARELHSPVGSWSDHVRPVSPLVTEASPRYWMRLVLECWDEQAEELGFDEFADVWMTILETEARPEVGYLGVGAY